MLAFCAANGAYLVGLESAFPQGACLVAGTGANVAAMLRRAGHAVVTVDEHDDVLRAVGSSSLNAGVVIGTAPVVELLQQHGCDAVLPFKSGPRLWTMAEHFGWRVLAADPKLTRQLENKLALNELAAAAEAQIPDTVTVSLDEALARAAQQDGISLPRVFQPAVGFAGAGTVMLRSSRDVVSLVEHPPGGVRVGKLVEYVRGEPVTVNGVVIPPGAHSSGEYGQVLVGMVARQLTGIDGLTPTDFGSCGNDWTNPPHRERVIATRALALRVGEVLAARGFAGAFGVDVILPENGGVPVLIEINPRWTASLALQVELQRVSGFPTLLDAHLAAFEYNPETLPSLEELIETFGDSEDALCVQPSADVSTVIAYNSSGVDVQISDQLTPGVWRAHRNDNDEVIGISWVRDGWRYSDLKDTDELLVVPAGPVRPIHHGSYLARIVLRLPAASNPQANQLCPDARTIIDQVLQRVQ